MSLNVETQIVLNRNELIDYSNILCERYIWDTTKIDQDRD